jgi:hypothetical protein
MRRGADEASVKKRHPMKFLAVGLAALVSIATLAQSAAAKEPGGKPGNNRGDKAAGKAIGRTGKAQTV